MFPWLLNLFTDSLIREVKSECTDKGLGLESINGGGFWRVNVLLFADDTVLLGESSESLQRLVNVFNRVCEKKKLVVNGGKSKVMKVGVKEVQREVRIRLGRRVELKQVDSFVYLGLELSAEGG